MTGLSKEQTEDLNKDLKEKLTKLKENPSDPALISNLILTAGLLGKHDVILEHCETLFYSVPENHGFLKMYILMLKQSALNDRFDLIEEHQKKFDESSLFEGASYSEDIAKSFETLECVFEQLDRKSDCNLSILSPYNP